MTTSGSGWNDSDGGGVALAAATCLRRLEHVGAPARPVANDPGAAVKIVADGSAPDRRHRTVECELSTFGPAPCPSRQGGEAAVQALSGLMAVSGRDRRRPERIGIEVASVAAGILATHGVLAGLIGAYRGLPVRAVGTSLLQAAVLLCSHYVAAATGEEDPAPRETEPEGGPPFHSADGTWFEIETLDAQAWQSFWRRLGAPDDVLGRAWTRFRARYFAGTCTLPRGLHEATLRHSLAELSAVAACYDVSLLPVRGYDEVIADLGSWQGTPFIDPLVADPGGSSHAARDRHGHRAGGRAPLPLDGLLVVEATTRMQGPLAAHLLRMLGASVVKVEPPGGDIGRMMPPTADGTGTFFLCFNRGKKSVELDLATQPGRAELVELASGADVFLHNWRPGKDRDWSLAPADLARHNSGLVYAQASGWGARPDLDRVLGMDFLVQAFTGLGYGLAPATEPPRTSRLTLTDFMGALVTCEGILGALYQRCRDGRGRLVDTSLLAGGVTLQAHILDALRSGREVARRAGRPVWGRFDQPIETTDGALVVSPAADPLRLAQACGLDGSLAESDLQRLAAEAIAAGRARDWQAGLTLAGIGCAVVRDDLTALPGDPVVADLLEPVGEGCYAAASPWSFAC